MKGLMRENSMNQRWHQVIALQVSSKAQVTTLKSESSFKSRQVNFKSSPKSETWNLK